MFIIQIEAPLYEIGENLNYGVVWNLTYYERAINIIEKGSEEGLKFRLEILMQEQHFKLFI